MTASFYKYSASTSSLKIRVFWQWSNAPALAGDPITDLIAIKEAAFVFGYGHTVVVLTPSLSLPAAFGIGFSIGTETMVEKAIRMDNTGNITEY